ncbi:uncharacterized protein EV420DRAFT_1300859 [Desarmillaria tabescens]|uniref:Uncharacterized protein n=1 Tax=Armillaria tabescens TaxID=1929756 RepID=A0AA39NI24_ARMTA|nr:uncharacterized protein EV420DRAFT_1300859 [Desarmillaria tabescens]KAK0466038.1 hypothetical protein EV420DRAFT_1300859 [Desarmillaria tabescens]
MPEVPIPHPPAVKVGGRRLSLSARHKPHVDTSTTEPTPARAVDDTVLDYPRPTGPPATDEERHDPHHQEELPPKKDKKQHGYLENEKKMREFAHHKAEANRPTRDVQPEHKGFGAGGRIAQPGGRSIDI